MRTGQRLLLCGIIAALAFAAAGCGNPFYPEKKVYTVTFNPNGGSEIKAVKGIVPDSAIKLPSPPDREGYTFAEWFTDNISFKNKFTETTIINADITVHAKWTSTVTFDSNGGTETEAVSGITPGSTITLPSRPEKEGHSFLGWFTDNGTFAEPFTETTAVMPDITVYAKWTADTIFTVTFESNGGSDVEAAWGITPGSVITLPAAPEKAGGNFAGWFIDNTTFEIPFTGLTAVMSDMTVYAKWTNSVMFESNGGSDTAPYTGIVPGSVVPLPAPPEKAGYDFAGWYTDNTTFADQFTSSTVVTSNITVYAKWTVTVTFDSNGGNKVPAVSGITPGSVITLPALPEKDGYSFLGWFTDNTTFANKFDVSTPVTSNITVYAKWTKDKTFTVTFESNGGTTVPAVSGIVLNAVITLPAPPARDGNTFGGWFTDNGAFTKPFTDATPVGANIIVYAKWTSVVMFETNDGSNVPAVTVVSDSPAAMPAQPSKTGNSFGGWYTDNKFTIPFTSSTVVTGNITVYAKWTSTVTFNSNGGTEVEAVSGITSGSAMTLPEPPEKEDYSFAGWYTDNGAFTNRFTSSTPVAVNITVYAKWTKDTTFTVTFDSNGGSEVGEVNGIIPFSTISLPVPERDGNTFAGWYKDNGTFLSKFDETTPVAGNIVLYAKWESVVTFEADNGKAAETVKVTSGSPLKRLPVPVKEGYGFAGWYTDKTYTTEFSESTVVNGDITVYAKWTRSVTVTFQSNGGSFGVETRTVASGLTVSPPAPPEKTGYGFGGWYFDDGTFLSKFDGSTPVTANTIVYARWTNTVTFNSNGGQDVAPIEVTTGSKIITLPANPTKTGSTFAGWYTDNGVFAKPFTSSTPVTADITVYAKWTVTVTFNSNGGSTVSPITVTSGSTITLPANPTKTGNTFAGWFKDNGTFANQFTASTPVTANITVYAKWTYPQITIKQVSTVINPAGEYKLDVPKGTSKDVTFTIANTGTAALSLTDVGGKKVNLSVTGAFQIISQPAVTSIAPGGSTTFVIRFTPQSYGDFSSIVSIKSNSLNNADFSFSVKGTGRPYVIGDTGPGGGIVFYDKGNSDNGWRYLEAALAETEFYAQWGTLGYIVAGTQTGIGTGKENTRIIVEYLAANTTETGRAAQLCDSLVYGGADDWFLPSKDELDLMYDNLQVKGLGGIGTGRYWSSSQGNFNSYAWSQSFSSGSQVDTRKTLSYCVRAVRAF